jgi:protein TonB
MTSRKARLDVANASAKRIPEKTAERRQAGATITRAGSAVDRAGGFVTRDTRAEVARWIAALLVAVGLHAGAVAWMLRTGPTILADSSPPAAIMIELTEAPEAKLTEQNEITPDQITTEDNVAQQEQKSEEIPEEKPIEKEPEPAEPVEKPVVEEKPVPLEKVEVPLPVEQPKKEEPKKDPPKEKPKEKPKQKPKEKPKPKQKASEQSKAATEAQTQVRRSDRNAAAQTASGVSSQAPANWKSQLMAHLERRKRYPPGARSRGERGTVFVRFTIDASGNVQSVNLSRSSGHAELDQEVLAMVRRASPVPAPPPGVQRDIIAPVRFNTN